LARAGGGAQSIHGATKHQGLGKLKNTTREVVMNRFGIDEPITYDVAQICRNGHVITNSLATRPEFGQPFCQKCGAKTISECPKCQKPIRGHSSIPVLSLSGPKRPAYCLHCGAAFPWTEEALALAAEYADDLPTLTAEERVALKGTISDLASDTVRTPIAASRFRKFMQKVGPTAETVMVKILENVVTEAAKKAAGF